jgi:hypothetical protein
MSGKRLTKEQVATMQRLIANHPELTNAQIGELVGTTGGTVGAEKRGVRTPVRTARRAALEKARRELGIVPANEPRDTFLAVDDPLANQAHDLTSVDQKVRELAGEIRLQALKELRKKLTAGDISPDDALAALGDER